MLPLLPLIGAAMAWTLRGPGGIPTTDEVDPATIFTEQPADWEGLTVHTDPAALAAVAAATLRYLQDNADTDPRGVQPGMLGELGIELAQIEQTLRFVVQIAAEDAITGASRLTDPAFLAAHFRLLAWNPDTASAAERGLTLPAGHIRLTRYLVYQLPGSATRTGTFTHALYAPPHDEDGLSLAEAEAAADRLCRFRYSRAEVMSGALEEGCSAEPLVWLTRRGVYEAMMQGTIEVSLLDGSRQLYNVARHNGMPYDPAIRSPSQQLRYWYFREVDGVMGWGAAPQDKVPLAFGASVAGDVYNLGLGKLIALREPAGLRLVVLADTGGAFQPNLFQLDFLTGAYPSHEAFQAATAHLPATVTAGILVLQDAP